MFVYIIKIIVFFIVPTHAFHYTLKHQNLTLKHLKFAPTCFGLLWNHLQGDHRRTLLGNWIGVLIYICYKEFRYVAVCQFIHLDQIGIHTQTHRRNELAYSHITTLIITNVNQHSNSVTYQSTAMDPLRMVSKETETCRGEF